MKKYIAVFLCVLLAIGLMTFIIKNRTRPEPEDIVPDPEPVPEPVPEPEPESTITPPDDMAQNKLTGLYDIDLDFEGTRPVAVMVNNITHSLPQRGVNDCDVLIECEVEGGITRTLAFFADYRKITEVGSVRSLRNQFLDLARPVDAMIIHVGCSAYATSALNEYRYATLDAFGCTIVKQDKARLGKYDSEHTWFTYTDLIENSISSLKMRTDDQSPDPVFNFAEYGSEATLDDGEAAVATWHFSDDYDGVAKYSQSTGTYLLWQHGKERYDELDSEQFGFDNVFIVVASRPGYYGAGVPKYDFSAGGTGYYLNGGKYEEFTWTKPDAKSRMVFIGSDGKELEVNRGRSYIAIVNTKQAGTITLSDHE